MLAFAKGASMHLALLLLYSVLLVGIGLYVGRKVRTTGHFFVAGRQLGAGLLFSTLLAANIGAGSTVNAAALGYRNGLSAWWWVGSAAIGSLALAFWVGPAVRRLAASHEFHTVGDFLEWRYSRAVRGVVTLLLLVGTLFILAGQLMGLAWVLNVVAGIDKPTGCLIGGAVMTTYFVAGGLLTSASVNAVQLVVLLAGFLLALPLALGEVGGLSALREASPAADYWSLLAGGGSGWMYLVMLGPAFIVSPGLLQKIYGARDDRAVRIGTAANGAVLFVFAFIPVILGMIARLLHPDLPRDDLALPTLLRADLPAVIGALGLAALFSAEVSTADAILFMLATSGSQDLYHRFVKPSATDGEVLRVARWTAVVGGALGVAIAIRFEAILTTLSIFYTVLSVTLCVPILMGLYVRRARVAEAVAAIATGIVVMVLVMATSEPGRYGPLLPALYGIGASFAAAVLVLIGRGWRGDTAPPARRDGAPLA
jgi:SSS family solute:Na+ symporter